MPTWLSVVDDLIVPILALPPTIPFTSQVTAVLVEVVAFVRSTTAEKSACDPGVIESAVGVIETAVTVVAPLPPPHPERMLASTANKMGRVNIREVR